MLRSYASSPPDPTPHPFKGVVGQVSLLHYITLLRPTSWRWGNHGPGARIGPSSGPRLPPATKKHE